MCCWQAYSPGSLRWISVWWGEALNQPSSCSSLGLLFLIDCCCCCCYHQPTSHAEEGFGGSSLLFITRQKGTCSEQKPAASNSPSCRNKPCKISSFVSLPLCMIASMGRERRGLSIQPFLHCKMPPVLPLPSVRHWSNWAAPKPSLCRKPAQRQLSLITWGRKGLPCESGRELDVSLKRANDTVIYRSQFGSPNYSNCDLCFPVDSYSSDAANKPYILY